MIEPAIPGCMLIFSDVQRLYDLNEPFEWTKTSIKCGFLHDDTAD